MSFWAGFQILIPNMKINHQNEIIEIQIPICTSFDLLNL